MRQYGLDVEYASLVSIRSDEQLSTGFSLDVPGVAETSIDGTPTASIFDVIGQGYGHDQALSAYVGQAFDSMMTERVLSMRADPVQRLQL